MINIEMANGKNIKIKDPTQAYLVSDEETK